MNLVVNLLVGAIAFVSGSNRVPMSSLMTTSSHFHSLSDLGMAAPSGLHQFAERSPFTAMMQVLTHSDSIRKDIALNPKSYSDTMRAAFVAQRIPGSDPIQLPSKGPLLMDMDIMVRIFGGTQSQTRTFYTSAPDEVAQTPFVELRLTDGVLSSSVRELLVEAKIGPDFVESLSFPSPYPAFLQIVLATAGGTILSPVIELSAQQYRLKGVIQGDVSTFELTPGVWYKDEPLGLMRSHFPSASTPGQYLCIYEKISTVASWDAAVLADLDTSGLYIDALDVDLEHVFDEKADSDTTDMADDEDTNVHGFIQRGSRPSLLPILQILTHSPHLHFRATTLSSHKPLPGSLWEALVDLITAQHSGMSKLPLNAANFHQALVRLSSTPINSKGTLQAILQGLSGELSELSATQLVSSRVCYTCFKPSTMHNTAREINVRGSPENPMLERVLEPFLRSDAETINCGLCGGDKVAGTALNSAVLPRMLWIVRLNKEPFKFSAEMDLRQITNDPAAKYTLTGVVEDDVASFRVKNKWYSAINESVGQIEGPPGGIPEILLYEQQMDIARFAEDSKQRSLKRSAPPPSPPSVVLPGLSGLVNLGNMCYLNAIVQMLSHATPFRLLMQDVPGSSLAAVVVPSAAPTDAEYGAELIRRLANLVNAQWAPKPMAALSASPVLRILAGVGQGTFAFGAMEDAHEALRTTLGYMEEGFKGNAAFPVDIIHRLFAITVERRRMCLHCSELVTYSDTIQELNLSLPQNSEHTPPMSLATMLAEYLSDETVGEVTCSACQVTGNAGVASTVTELPPLLVVVLKRFDASGNKLTADVTFEDNIDFTDFPDFPDDKYVLIGVVRHLHNIAHYVTEFKHPDTNLWYLANDSSVSPLPNGPTRSGAEPYILLYQRTTGETMEDVVRVKGG